jgi:hypothetical protein
MGIEQAPQNLPWSVKPRIHRAGAWLVNANGDPFQSIENSQVAEDIRKARNSFEAMRAALKFVAESGHFECFDDAGWKIVNDALDLAGKE